MGSLICIPGPPAPWWGGTPVPAAECYTCWDRLGLLWLTTGLRHIPFLLPDVRWCFLSRKRNEIEVCCLTAAVLYFISSLLEVLQLFSKPPEGAVSLRMAVWLRALQLMGMQGLGWLQGWHAAGTLGAKSGFMWLHCDFSSQCKSNHRMRMWFLS